MAALTALAALLRWLAQPADAAYPTANVVEFDVKIAGEDAMGTLSVDGAKIEMLKVAGQMYVRLDAAFWKQSAGDDAEIAAELVGDRWLKVSEKDDFGSFFEMVDPDELLSLNGKLTKGETKAVNGIDAIGVMDATDGGTVWVATTGEAYPLLMEASDGSGQITFADFGAKFDGLKAPAEGEAVDLEKLTGK